MELIPPGESIKYSSETVIYFGVAFYCWGHVLTDNIRRVWFLKSDYFKNQFKNCSLVYLPHGSMLDNQPNFRRLLEILEVDVDKLKPIKQPTQFKRIIIPDESFFGASFRKFTNEYRETIDCLRNFALKNRTPTSSKKIYYFYGQKQIGEERLAEYLRSKGYDIISPEKLTLDEQLNFLINAESFAAPIGSISHNSIFLRDNTEAIFIPRYSPFNFHQGTLNQLYSLNAIYIDSSLSIFYKWPTFGQFCFIISPQLRKFFGDKFDGYDEEDFKIFLNSVKYSLSKGDTFNPATMPYYKSFLEDFMTQLKKREDLITACNMPPHWEEFQPSDFCYQTHISTKGWGAWTNEDKISNDIGQNSQIEAIKIYLPKNKVYYSVYYDDKEGWSEEVAAPDMAGTTGKSKAIFGIKIRLDEAGAKKFDILYRVHKFDGSWTAWAKNGEVIYSHGQKLNAIQIKLEAK